MLVKSSYVNSVILGLFRPGLVKFGFAMSGYVRLGNVIS
jgi:hypothetical protein